jgi:uncharacterized protein YcbK (DUF882 family)
MNPQDKISKYFTYKEALWLPQWNRCATSEDGLTDDHIQNLKELFTKMDEVREFFGAPVIVHVSFRPQIYNAQVNGSKRSAHMEGKAVDFHVKGLNCDDARAKLLPKLDELGFRMENLPNSGWVHLDTRVPGPSGRFFKP